MTVLLAPTATAPATRLGGRTFRKQILRAGGLDYRTPDGKSRRLEFDGAYFNDLSKAFRERAYDSVKAIVADDANRHTMDPERIRGTVVDLVPSDDGSGLDAIMTLSEDTAALVDEHPDLGVSARIVENHQRGDGKSWPRAVQHVLLTTDPRVTGLSPWESVNLAHEGHEVVDLSSAEPTQEGPETMPGLSDDDVNRIAEALHGRFAQGAAGAGAPAGEGQGAGGAGPEGGEGFDLFADDVSDADLEAFLNEGGEGGAYTGADALGEPVGADLSNPDGGADPRFVDLAEQNAVMAEQMATMNGELSAARWERERDALLSQGVPPVMLELATPILQAAHQGAVLDLSNSSTGETVSPPDVVRAILRQAAGIVDLSAEAGHGAPSTAEPGDTTAAHAVWEQSFGGK